MSRNKVLIVPGWYGSGPAHWQTIWEQNHPEYLRVAQNDWRSVHRPDWVQALDRAVRSASGDVILVAHSLGCLAVAWWAATGAGSSGNCLLYTSDETKARSAGRGMASRP